MRLLSENGNQRKYNTSVKELLKKPIYTPDCQRSIMQDHVTEIVNFQKEHFSKKYHYIFLNCIQFCVVLGVWYCVDGQHRYEAVKRICREVCNFPVTVEIVVVDTLDEVKENYKILNLMYQPCLIFQIPLIRQFLKR